ncbi:PREDICTED: neuropeptide F receptor-like [Priapulus caudatus]|uniref:Neuropeptide F receptor-like n=1 Tax=Priapulus caudatus TaxID=37621 RepID=A0ABM1EYD6_PRICU|nr:PREDICTED: neuropeptide F receptor-like [Priapulus caudatus]
MDIEKMESKFRLMLNLLKNITGNDKERMSHYLSEFVEKQGMSTFDVVTQNILISMFCVLISIGSFGNSLVCIAVIRKPQMRTARNVFIVNLALSDLTLCLFTMPFTLAGVIRKDWNFGMFMCKLVRAFQATNVFVSTMSITAIALDRYQVIIYPTKENMQKVGSVLILGGIWLVAFLMATPMFIYHDAIDLIPPDYGITLKVCAEVWPIAIGGFIYTVMTMLFQYVLPIVIVSAAYARICRKLEYRMVSHASATKDQRRRQQDERRKRKTNQLLIAIAVVFVISWLPINIFNLYMFYMGSHSKITSEQEYIIFAVCYMMAMSSACSNPLLYGWLNDNFRKEFNDLLCQNRCIGAIKRFTARPERNSVPMVIYTKTQQSEVERKNSQNNVHVPEASAATQVEHMALSVGP